MDLTAPPPTPPKARPILVVDDDAGMRSLFHRLLQTEGYDVEFAIDGATALSAIAARAPDVVLLDLEMPGMDGLQVCREIRRNPETRLLPVVIVTGLNARSERLAALEAGADDFLTKPVDAGELLVRVRSLARMKQYTDDLDSAASIIMTLATMIEARDGYSDGHCHRMANYATSLGRALHLDDYSVQLLYRGGFLHDIGMLAISDAVLRKPGPLEPEEWASIKSHTIVGDTLCSNLRSLQAIRPMIRSHHERLDGSGYPDGLRGRDVPLLAQIVGVVDVYEALTTDRPYQQAHTTAEAFGILRNQVLVGWRNGDLVETFAEVIAATATVR